MLLHRLCNTDIDGTREATIPETVSSMKPIAFNIRALSPHLNKLPFSDIVDYPGSNKIILFLSVSFFLS